MTTELTYLAWTLVLAVVQILAFDIARTRQYGTKWNTGARDGDMPPLKPMVARLQRAQNNLFETLPLFIAAVLISNLGHRDSSTTTLGVQIYFWGRVAYLPLYAVGVPLIRSLVWIGSMVGLGMIFYAILLPA